MADEAVGHLRENLVTSAKVEVWNRKKKKGGSPFGTEGEEGVPPMPAFGGENDFSLQVPLMDALDFKDGRPRGSFKSSHPN